MIPKVIHYCWFGGKPLPKSALKCIESWKRYFPDYKIKEWNETNYDISKIEYIKQAYQEKKYAFVSDYARFDILYHEGGIYFDTDVEVVRSFDDILAQGAFMGFEEDATLKKCGQVNPGLGMGVEPQNSLYKDILDYYRKQSFYRDDGAINTETVVTKITHVLQHYGLRNIEGIQWINGIGIYPKEYFNPKDSSSGRINKTKNTHSVHWYSSSWFSPSQRIRNLILSPIHYIVGGSLRKRHD